MSKMAIICFVFASLCLFFPLLGIAKENSLVSKDETCKITASLADWPPYQYFTKDGKAAGVQIELVNAIADKADCQIKYIQKNFYETITDIKQGNVDMALNSTPIESRKTFAYFSIPYRQELFVLYATPKFIEDCKSKDLAELVRSGFRLGLQKKSYYGDIIEKIKKDPELNRKLVYIDKIIDHYDLLKNNQLDGMIDDPTIVAYKLRKEFLTGFVLSCKITVYSSDLSIMFSKKTVPQWLVKRFNKAIKQVKQTPKYQSRWVWR